MSRSPEPFCFHSEPPRFLNSRASNSLDTLPEWLRGSPAKRVCYARTGSNPVGVALGTFLLRPFRLSRIDRSPPKSHGTCTCGLDGHDARFTRERSRVRVTARVHFVLFFYFARRTQLLIFFFFLFFFFYMYENQTRKNIFFFFLWLVGCPCRLQTL